MKRCLLLAICVLVWSNAPAQVPRTLSYQGVLTDSLGNPKPDGTYNFTFRLYDASTGGSPLWTDTKDLYVSKGLFTTMLGDKTPFGASVAFDRHYWLGVTLEPGPELSPRMELASAAYSISALQADSARITGTVPDGSVTNAKIPTGQVVKSINSIKDNVTLAGGSNVSIVQSGDTLKVSATPGGSGDITGVTAGKGLTGGGSSGDVSLGLDTTLTDTRYVNEGQSSSVTTGMIAASAVNSTKIANGTVVRSLNGRTDALNIVAGEGMTSSSTSNTITLSAPRVIKPYLNPTSLSLPVDGTRTWRQLWQIAPTQDGYVMILIELGLSLYGSGPGGAWTGFYITTSPVAPTSSTVPMNQQGIETTGGAGTTTFRIYEFTVTAGTTYYVWFSGQYIYRSPLVTSASLTGMKWTLLHFTGTAGM